MRLQYRNIRLALTALTTALILAGSLPASAAVSAATSETEVPAPVADNEVPALTTDNETPALTADNEVPALTADNETPALTTDNEVPPFSAYIGFSGQGYAVFGNMTFPDGTSRVQNLYSLDGENYEVYDWEWQRPVVSGCAIKTPQICLKAYNEPLKSYLAGTLDRFYLKLLITRDDGTTYESEPAVISREPQPVPDGLTLGAGFDSSMRVRGPSYIYGRYQLTVKEYATADEIASYLPKTLPVKVYVGEGICVVDCPVTWKPFTVTELTPGESVIIADAAEPISVPAGTLLDTPLGVFQLDEPLLLGDGRWNANEVQLILNVISADDKPSGSLAVDRGALKIALTWKPTGATAIRAYTLTEGETEWTEVQGQQLEKTLNAQLSTPNGGATILDADAELIRSYLEADAAGNTPTPFLVGIKIEGGVYDGKQLVLPWPAAYGNDLPYLPEITGGSGGNEGNAGSDNKDDSTDEGQRPNLPQQPEDTGDLPDGSSGETNPDNPSQPENIENPSKDSENGQIPSGSSQPETGENPPQGSENGQTSDRSPQPETDEHTSQDSEDEQNPDDSPQPEGPADNIHGQQSDLSHTIISQTAGNDENAQKNSETGQTPDDPEQAVSPTDHETTADAGDGQRARLPQKQKDQKTTTDTKNHDSDQSISSKNTTAQGFVSQGEAAPSKNNTTSPIAVLAVAGTAGIAGVCAVISCKGGTALFFHRIAGKIRSILHGMIKR